MNERNISNTEDLEKLRIQIQNLESDIDSERNRLQDLENSFYNARSGKEEYAVDIEQTKYRIEEKERQLEEFRAQLDQSLT